MKYFPAFIVVVYLLSWVLPYDVVGDVDASRVSCGMSAVHWLGCDHVGRDILMRLIIGVQSFFAPGMGAALGVVGLGVVVGAWVGMEFVGAGIIRYLLGSITAIPRFVLALLLMTAFSGTLFSSTTILVGAGILAELPLVVDALSSRITELREREFVLSLRVHGVSPGWILGYHLIWVNGGGILLRHAQAAFGGVLVLESALSYLGGYGVAEPVPSWGNMVAFELGVAEGNWLAWAAPAFLIWLGAWATWGFGGRDAADS